MNSIVKKLKHEFLEIIPPAIFFFVAFQLLAFTQTLLLRQHGIHVTTIVAATIGALLVAKVVLVADLFPIINRFPDRPLIYNVAWKTALYFVAAWVVRYLEQLFHVWRRYHSLGAANRHLLDELVWEHVLVVQMWLLVLLFVYCSLRELTRVLGPERVLQMFFGRRAARPLQRATQ